MFECEEKIPSDLLGIIKDIIQTDTFKEINDIVNICDLNQDIKDVIKNIEEYIWDHIAGHNKEEFPKAVRKFITFFENYQNKKSPNFTLPSKDGDLKNIKKDLLSISSGYHIYKDYRFFKKRVNGFYMKGAYLGTDHAIYLAKKSMISRSLPVNDEIKWEVDFNPIMASEVFSFFEKPAASYYVAKQDGYPFKIILTRSFLKENQELISLSDLYGDVLDDEDIIDTYTSRINIIKNNLFLRYKDKLGEKGINELIEKVCEEYCIQEFFKQLIGPMDINYGNTSLILTNNGSSVPGIDIAPAYDLDVSFHISDGLMDSNILGLIRDKDNQPITMFSLIEEFKNYKGFREFLKEFARIITSEDVASKIVQRVIDKTNLIYFHDHQKDYIDILNKRFESFMEAYKKSMLGEDEKSEVTMGR